MKITTNVTLSFQGYARSEPEFDIIPAHVETVHLVRIDIGKSRSIVMRITNRKEVTVTSIIDSSDASDEISRRTAELNDAFDMKSWKASIPIMANISTDTICWSDVGNVLGREITVAIASALDRVGLLVNIAEALGVSHSAHLALSSNDALAEILGPINPVKQAERVLVEAPESPKERRVKALKAKDYGSW